MNGAAYGWKTSGGFLANPDSDAKKNEIGIQNPDGRRPNLK
jgi:hypothetical protein